MPNTQFARSIDQHNRSKLTLAGGIATAIRASQQPVPLCFSRASGSHMWDIDGNEYIDYTLSYGPLMQGHSPSHVLDAVRQQLEAGVAFGASHRYEAELAEAVCRTVPSAEMCIFSSTGTEAVQSALKIARTFTGRQKIVKFFGHYHGWVDSVSVGGPGQTNRIPGTNGQDPGAYASTLICEWDDLEQLRELISEEIAAVIMEPFNVNGGCVSASPGYLEEVRRVTSEAGALLIFDEVVTGYRLALGGAQELFGVMPDLTVLGKAMAAGFPIGAVAGRADVMSLVASGRVSHMGNFNANPVSASAGVAAITALERDASVIYPKLHDDSMWLASMIEEESCAVGIPIRVNAHTGVAHAFVSDHPVETHAQWSACDSTAYADFARALVVHGIHVTARGVLFVSTVHTQDDLEQTRIAVKQALASMVGAAA